MPKVSLSLKQPAWIKELLAFFPFLKSYFRSRGYLGFRRFEFIKGFVVDLLYKKRGRYTRPFLHLGTIGLVFVAIILGPFILDQTEEDERPGGYNGVLAASAAYGKNFQHYQSGEIT